MKPKGIVVPVLVVVVLAVAMLACSMDLGFPAQTPPQVITIVVPATPAPAVDTPVPPAPTDTPRPTDTPTLVPAAFTATELSNCRAGPSPVYPLVEGIGNGQTVPIVGKSDSSWSVLWWVVRVGNTECWVWGDLGTTSGDLSQVQPRVAPPTPTPVALVEVSLKNNWRIDVCFVFARVHGTSNWGEDRLGNQVIEPKTYGFFKLAPGYYDFRIEDCADNPIDEGDNFLVDKDHNAFVTP